MKWFILFLLLTITSISLSQEQQKASVEKSIYGIQIGILGIWAHNEYRISNEISLRSEIGLDMAHHENENGTKNSVGLIPSIRLEPRWYYNLDKRIRKGRKISNNSGNFLTLNITYNPDWFLIPSNKNVNVIETIAFIPKWGIKRTIGKHLTYEAGIGIGGFIALENYETDNHVAGEYHLRVGYTF